MKTMSFSLAYPDISMWRGGNTSTEGVWHFDSGRPGRHVLISALVHGNELCGAWALKGLLEAGIRPAKGKLTLIFANLAAFDHFDPAQHDASRYVDEDMNRQWLDERIQSASSYERKRVAELAPWVRQADRLLDLHSMHEPGPPLLLTGMHQRNLELARELGSPMHIVMDGGHEDGVRMRDYGHFGLPDLQAAHSRSVLIECGFHGDFSSRDVARDQCARFLACSGVVDTTTVHSALPGWQGTDANEQWVLEVTGRVVARSDRFRFTVPYQGLECIPCAGTVIGDNAGEPVTTPYDDCILVMPSTRQARAGVTVVRFARRSRLT
jgi:predicted deacylase